MGYPLPDRAAAGRCIYSKRVEILVKKHKNNDLVKSEADYMYKTLTKCISNEVRIEKKIIKKRGLAELKKMVYIN